MCFELKAFFSFFPPSSSLFFFSPLQGLLFLKTKLKVRLANSRSFFDRSLSVLGPEGAAKPLQAMVPGLLWPTGHSRRAGLGPACINPASRFVNKRLSDDLWLWKELTALSLVPGEATRKIVVSLLSFRSYLHLFFSSLSRRRFRGTA